MKDINDLFDVMWCIKTSIVALFWEFLVTILCIYFVPAKISLMTWLILTIIVIGAWFVVYIMQQRWRKNEREQDEAEETAEE